MENVTIGRIVWYSLSPQDVEALSRRRVERVGHSESWPAGAQAHVGNPHEVGQVVPTIVVWPHHNEDSTFNGQAFLDGNDVLWITSARYDKDGAPGTWRWPDRA